MTASPEDLKPLPQSIENTYSQASLAEPRLDGNADLTQQDSLILVRTDDELTTAERLLRSVSIDENGVAYCENDASGQETTIAAVCIDSAGKAKLMPLRYSGIEALSFDLPEDQALQVGFFVGRTASQRMSAALRTGPYPGEPTSTRITTEGEIHEVTFSVNGFALRETGEKQWASQIGLFTKLGFDPQKTRGLFKKIHRPSTNSNTWREQPLVVSIEDSSSQNEFQVLLFQEKSHAQLQQAPEPTNGTEAKAAPAVGPTRVSSLEGAFKIIVIRTASAEKPEKESEKEPGPEFHDQALAQIKSRLDRIGLGRIYPRLEPDNIFAPKSISDRSPTTLRNLGEAGLPQGPRVVFVKPDGQVARNTLHISATASFDFEDTDSSQNGRPVPNTQTTYHNINLTSQEFFGVHETLILSVKSPQHGLSLVTKRFTQMDNPFAKMNQPEIPLGSSAGQKGEHVLLLADDGKGKIHIASLTLPIGWKALFKDGMFTDRPDQMPSASDLFTEQMHTVSRLIASTKYSKDTLFEIRKHLENFPFSNLLPSTETRVAELSAKRTPVEIKLTPSDTILTFFRLDLDKLRQHCQEDNISLTTLADAFPQHSNSPNRMVLTVSLNRHDQIRVVGKILSWNQTLTRFEDTTDKFPQQLQKLLSTRAVVLPYFLLNLRKNTQEVVKWTPQAKRPEQNRNRPIPRKPQRADDPRPMPEEIRAIRYIDTHLKNSRSTQRKGKKR